MWNGWLCSQTYGCPKKKKRHIRVWTIKFSVVMVRCVHVKRKYIWRQEIPHIHTHTKLINSHISILSSHPGLNLDTSPLFDYITSCFNRIKLIENEDINIVELIRIITLLLSINLFIKKKRNNTFFFFLAFSNLY